MKKTIGFSLAVAATLLLSSNAMALPSAGTAIISGHGYGTTNGGEFNIAVTEGGTLKNYISFCLEIDEHIDYNKSYIIDSVADYAEARTNYGRGADNTGKDNLDVKTKWVFWNYINKTLTYDQKLFNGLTNEKDIKDRKTNAVQYAIWVIEEEVQFKDILNIYKDQYNAWFPTTTNTGYSIDGIVQALNISKDGLRKQSQIIGEAAPVPEPTTMLLFGTGLAGLAGIARRRKNI